MVLMLKQLVKWVKEESVRTATTVFKHRLLERAGFKLASVPHHELANVDVGQYIYELENKIIK